MKIWDSVYVCRQRILLTPICWSFLCDFYPDPDWWEIQNVAIYFQIIHDRNRIQREARAVARLPNANARSSDANTSARLSDSESIENDGDDTTTSTTSQQCVVCFSQAKEGTINKNLITVGIWIPDLSDIWILNTRLNLVQYAQYSHWLLLCYRMTLKSLTLLKSASANVLKILDN